MGLIGAVVCLVIFVANVALGSISGAPLLGNVMEMILLFVASVFFVAHILKCEAKEGAAKERRN
jgi:hypothetical protein